ncbi:cytochrome c biogenesis CcdA family protein [Verrucomicrobiota bacterium]
MKVANSCSFSFSAIRVIDKKVVTALNLILLAFLFMPAAIGRINDARCRLDFYYIPGCEQCRHVEQQIFPQIRELFGDRVNIRKHNLYDSTEYAEMLKMRAVLNIKNDDNVFFIVNEQDYVGGLEDIRENLIPAIEYSISSGLPYEQAIDGRQPAYNALQHYVDSGASLLEGGFTRPLDFVGQYGGQGRGVGQAGNDHSFPFSLAVLVLAGFLDGINPCAFATIVFLITSLLAGGGRREKLLFIGLGFCIAVFLTYFLIGLGLFQFFRLSYARLWLGNLLNWVLIVGLFIMAYISFHDAFLYRRTGRQEGIVMKLPGRITRIIHKLIRLDLSKSYDFDGSLIRLDLSNRHYFAGSFLLGCIVTILESICTGQLYVPTLAFLARESTHKIQAIAGLALYDFMFILPLIIVFFIAHHGARYSVFISWSKKDFFWARCATGCFFIFLATLLYIT